MFVSIREKSFCYYNPSHLCIFQDIDRFPILTWSEYDKISSHIANGTLRFGAYHSTMSCLLIKNMLRYLAIPFIYLYDVFRKYIWSPPEIQLACIQTIKPRKNCLCERCSQLRAWDGRNKICLE